MSAAKATRLSVFFPPAIARGMSNTHNRLPGAVSHSLLNFTLEKSCSPEFPPRSCLIWRERELPSEQVMEGCWMSAVVIAEEERQKRPVIVYSILASGPVHPWLLMSFQTACALSLSLSHIRKHSSCTCA